MSPPPAVRFADAGFAYAGRAPIVAGLNLTIAAGEVVVLVGRSGAGKSTLLKLINGLILPSGGSVEVDGRDTRTWDAVRLRRHIGYVLQDVGLFPHLTVAANVGIVPRLEGWSPARTRERVQELLSLVGLPAAEYAERRPADLSGGQRQRVGVARALAIGPPILLMDEPFGALDPVTRLELRREFSTIRRALGTTVVLVTHDMGEAFALADRIGVIDAGALVALDTPEAIARADDPRVRALLETVAAPRLDGTSP